MPGCLKVYVCVYIFLSVYAPMSLYVFVFVCVMIQHTHPTSTIAHIRVDIYITQNVMGRKIKPLGRIFWQYRRNCESVQSIRLYVQLTDMCGFMLFTALTLVVDFGRLISVFLNRNCLLRLLFSIWSMSVTWIVPLSPPDNSNKDNEREFKVKRRKNKSGKKKLTKGTKKVKR